MVKSNLENNVKKSRKIVREYHNNCHPYSYSHFIFLNKG